MKQVGELGALSTCFAGSMVGKSSALHSDSLVEEVHPTYTVQSLRLTGRGCRDSGPLPVSLRATGRHISHPASGVRIGRNQLSCDELHCGLAES